MNMKAILPTRALALLIGIGFIDLIVTAVLHDRNLITEMNPLRRIFITRSELLFAFVKGSTLVAAWWLMARYAMRSEQNLAFVRKCSLVGSATYMFVWTSWFLIGTFSA